MAINRKSDAELARAILEETNQPVHFRVLIEEILKRQKKELSPENMATVYTSLNMDHELVHSGEGYWDRRK
jgi:DNA-directed RNA polymerase delta subunit